MHLCHASVWRWRRYLTLHTVSNHSRLNSAIQWTVSIIAFALTQWTKTKRYWFWSVWLSETRSWISCVSFIQPFCGQTPNFAHMMQACEIHHGELDIWKCDFLFWTVGLTTACPSVQQHAVAIMLPWGCYHVCQDTIVLVLFISINVPFC